ncbi:MAG: nucleotide pyrophosphatase, partial [bacterium]
LLGRGIAHRKISDFLGNFLACGIGNKMIRYRGFIPGKKKYYLGQHAGFTEEEMIVPLIFIEK